MHDVQCFTKLHEGLANPDDRGSTRPCAHVAGAACMTPCCDRSPHIQKQTTDCSPSSAASQLYSVTVQHEARLIQTYLPHPSTGLRYVVAAISSYTDTSRAGLCPQTSVFTSLHTAEFTAVFNFVDVYLIHRLRVIQRNCWC